MTFATLQAAVSRRVNNERFWDADDIKRAVNAAYVEVCEYTECFETETTLALIPGQTYYDLEYPAREGGGMRIDEFAADPSVSGITALERMRIATVGFSPSAENNYLAALVPLRVWNNQTKVWLDITTVSVLDRERGRWYVTGGAPDRWFHRGFSTFGIYPKPLTSTTDTLLVRHSAVPNLMVEAGDVPEVPRQFTEVLELGAMTYLKGLEREPRTATAYWKEYVDAREDLFNHVQQRTSRMHIPTYGGAQVGARR